MVKFILIIFLFQKTRSRPISTHNSYFGILGSPNPEARAESALEEKSLSQDSLARTLFSGQIVSINVFSAGHSALCVSDRNPEHKSHTTMATSVHTLLAQHTPRTTRWSSEFPQP